jgi:hypothetical protein
VPTMKPMLHGTFGSLQKLWGFNNLSDGRRWSVQIFPVALTSDIASVLSPLRLANVSGRYAAHKRLSLSGSFLRTIFTIQGAPNVFMKLGHDQLNQHHR